MKHLFYTILIVAGFSWCPPEKTSPRDDFELTFMTCGMGSNMGKMFPVMHVKGLNYKYTSEQTSYYVKPDQKPVSICSGTFRPSSIDSIITLAKIHTDTLIYVTNPNIMSGTIQRLQIWTGNKKLEFTMHNEGHATARKIVEILNSNLPAGKEKMGVIKV